MNDDLLTMTIAYAPGTLTAQKALAIGQAWVDVLNAQAKDIDPTIGDPFTVKHFVWIDDGKDTMTLQTRVAPGTGGGAAEEGQKDDSRRCDRRSNS